MNRGTLGMLLVAIGLTLACALPTLGAKRDYRARLLSADPASSAITDHQAIVRFRFSKDSSRLRYRIVTAEALTLQAVTLHLAPAGRDGPLVAVLHPGPASLGKSGRMVAKGSIESSDLFGPMVGQPLETLLTAMTGRYVCVRIDTGGHGSGELQGWTR